MEGGGITFSIKISKSATAKQALKTVLRQVGILSEEAAPLYFASLLKIVNSLSKEFAPLGANSFLKE